MKGMNIIMNIKFSRRTNTVKASEIRELLKIIDKKDIISFGGGLPAEETFPIDEMKDICNETLSEEGSRSMQYSTSEGHIALRNLIVDIMKEKGVTIDIDNILITTGSQQGLDLSAKVFIDEGDSILCESPTYLAAINAFKPFYPNFIDVKMDDNGLIIEELEKILELNKNIKFLYTIPDFQNPTGVTLSLERRIKLMELANKYDLIIIEDNPYSELRYEKEALPILKSLDTEGRVIYVSTFSKIVCPGYRIGWVCASKEIINKYVLFKQGTDLHTNIFSQMQVARFFQKYDIKEHTKKNALIYKKKRDVMLEAIEQEFPKCIKYTKPNGGMFIWVELPEYMNSKVLLQKTLAKGVAFVSGSSSFPNGGHENTLRLNYSGLPEDKIRKGIKILSEVIKDNLLSL